MENQPCRVSEAFRDWARRNSRNRFHAIQTHQRRNTCQSLSASRAQAPRSVRSITSSSPTAFRDGRFIELGYFNPLLPKDSELRLKLDMEKVKTWLAKGAQPSDRVMRFLDAAGVKKREPRKNPEKAVPRKERKAAAAEAAKS